ncbi:MAG: hypothetical protein LGR52_14820 [Candidatus Thiosymbion ectosymbiont of Robbea hypermnestra]|nr:hypothetical protein [Candidatus Thiosymbion ectosymbiont of Robbea hypermnestra]
MAEALGMDRKDLILRCEDICCNDVPKPLITTACDKPGDHVAGCDYYQARHKDFVVRHSCCEPPKEPPDYYLSE